ncbi:hypothetical protein DFH29DRAFT_809909, partial [Suillus ampliporus]
VLTPTHENLIRRSFEAVAGAKHVILHMYNVLCPMFQDVVFCNSKAQTVELVARHSKLISELADQYTASHRMKFCYEYSPETFTQTELEFSLKVCEAIKVAWGKAGPSIDHIIFNLPATVEVAPPNHYADQVEYFAAHISEQENVIISLHPHNE